MKNMRFIKVDILEEDVLAFFSYEKEERKKYIAISLKELSNYPINEETTKALIGFDIFYKKCM